MYSREVDKTTGIKCGQDWNRLKRINRKAYPDKLAVNAMKELGQRICVHHQQHGTLSRGSSLAMQNIRLLGWVIFKWIKQHTVKSFGEPH